MDPEARFRVWKLCESTYPDLDQCLASIGQSWKLELGISSQTKMIPGVNGGGL